MNVLTHEPLTVSWRADNIGRLLNNAIKRFESRILAEMEKAGYSGFSLSHVTITRNLDTEGTRATELARRAGITKQSMGELIIQLEQSGIIKRQPDPSDRRAKIIFFTSTGLEWLNAFRTALNKAEQEMCAELGEDAFKVLRDSLLRYDRHAA